ncbi:hypothetical protein EV137_3144 [Kribbella pratensis]|uniref:Aminoglycoside phosphotransferase domain-containing protein n=1 Tax=Kribbella pratensis TaxID=2512112 RepID=A0ABY2FEG4_9ACTN|nr:hypothetical protein [Kribbella pratensis]TDW89351.1 hypothetical protein EV137_3144 [Kribbella pratensis]
MPGSEEVALAFDLGTPDGDLIHVRRGDADAWRLNTSTGSYFVKGYLAAADVHQLELAMAFERQALASGVDMPEPIAPTNPLLGWVTRIEDRLFRVYRWIEHRPPEPDISAWLGGTMAKVHELQPLGRAGLPRWWRQAVQPPGTWQGWFTHNIVTSPSGPVLVDWDSVRTDSAALEAGRSAYIFGDGEPEQIKRILTAYVAAGGDLGWAGADLFLSVARNVVQVLGEQIRVSLGETTAVRWMGDHTTIENAIGNTLRDLPGKLDQLHRATQTIDLL